MQRIARLRDLMRAEGLDGVVLTHPHDVLYPTGYRSVPETQGTYEDFWIDTNSTATIGPPSDEYQSLHGTLVDAFNTIVAELVPGATLDSCP
jgi:Xaa-Pro aminopeptidase